MSLNQKRIELFKLDLKLAFKPTHLSIEDESHLHAGHAGAASGGGNVTITQTSAKAVINPNGIAITTSGMVNVGRGFVASSADIADSHNG